MRSHQRPTVVTLKYRQFQHPGAAMKQPLSPSAERALKRLGANISKARRQRQCSQEAMAQQIGASVSTVRRLEAGDSGVALQHQIGTLMAFGEIDQLNALFDTSRDAVGLLIRCGGCAHLRARPTQSGGGRPSQAGCVMALTRKLAVPQRVTGSAWRSTCPSAIL